MFQSFKVDQNYRKIPTPPMPIRLVRSAGLIVTVTGHPPSRTTRSTERWSTTVTRSSSASRTAASWSTPGRPSRRRNTIWSTPARRTGGLPVFGTFCYFVILLFCYLLQLKVIDIDHIFQPTQQWTEPRQSAGSQSQCHRKWRRVSSDALGRH